MNKKVFLSAIDALEEQGIAREITIKALQESFETIVKKKHIEGLPDLMVRVDIIPEKGKINIFNIKNVVEEVTDDAIEVSLEDALETNPKAVIGGTVEYEIEVDDFSRADALKFKSILKQKIKEAEKQAILAIYSDRVDEIITGRVEKTEDRYTLINIDRTSVVLSDKEKIGDEQFEIGDSVKVYLESVGSGEDAGIKISRACPGFLKRLFEEEIHDVYDGTVVITGIAREAGERSKVSVTTNDINVDPVGACIGPAGSKIKKICDEINHEKIDIIQYHKHLGLFVVECLKPANVLGVKLNEDGSAIAVVNDGDLRVAIGRRGVNARLAVKLAGCKIDIKELSTATSEGIEYKSIDEMKAEEERMKFEERKAAILEQIAREEEERKARAAEEEARRAEEETTATEEVAPVEETPVEEAPVEETVEETPVEEVVEFKPVIMQSKISLADLEKQIENDKKKKSNQPVNNFKKKEEKTEEKTEKKNVQRMDIYTQEELDDLDAEYEYDDESYDDDDIDYDDYDEYYEDN